MGGARGRGGSTSDRQVLRCHAPDTWWGTSEVRRSKTQGGRTCVLPKRVKSRLGLVNAGLKCPRKAVVALFAFRRITRW